MAGLIPVQVQVAELNGSSAGQRGMPALDSGDLHGRQARLVVWKPVEEVVQRKREPICQREPGPPVPTERVVVHPEIRFRSARS